MRVEARRGTIRDRKGRIARRQRRRARPSSSGRPTSRRRAATRDEAARQGRPHAAIELIARLERGKSDPLTPITVKVAVHEDQVAYLSEHAASSRGHAPTYLRKYNTEALLAHVLGYVGEINAEQLKRLRRRAA